MSSRTPLPTRAKLDRGAVVDAALEVADAEGLDAVTIRRLAQDLAVTPMALYWHFKDKDALLAAVGARIWDDTAAELDPPASQPTTAGGWDRLRATMDALVGAMRRHPAAASLVPSQVFDCPAGLSVTDRTLALLADLGFDPSRASVIARFVLCSAVMLVDNQPGAEITQPAERAEVQRLKRLALDALPPGRYPHLMAAAAYMTDCDSADSYFDQGIQLVVAGVQQVAGVRGSTS